MGLVTLLCLMFTTVIAGVALHRSYSTHFPLDDCSTGEMDILFLYFESSSLGEFYFGQEQFKELEQHISSFPSSEINPRVKFAQVYDRFSALDPLVNVSSWQFQTSPQPLVYGYNGETPLAVETFSVQETIEQKVAFTQRLFSEMAGVRQSVTHVAVIFLDGGDLSFEESRSVPHIVKQRDTDVKIFTAVVSDKLKGDLEPVHLNDALVASLSSQTYHTLTMAICYQCSRGWFPFKHNVGADELSCYKLVDNGAQQEYSRMKYSYHQPKSGRLATVETDEELGFLQRQISLFLKTSVTGKKGYTNSSTKPFYIHVGLKRDSESVATVFQWSFGDFHYMPRPLAINNWLPGKPSDGHTNGCGVWQFSRDNRSNVSDNNVSASEDVFPNGWMDVRCDDKVTSFYLFEMVVSRRVEEHPFLKIKPASDNTIRKLLQNKEFIEYGNQIVSISANVASEEFFKFLKETFAEIPVFECSANIYKSQYISYLFVCDYVDHCSNRADEAGCGTIVGEMSFESWFRKECFGVSCCNSDCLPLNRVNDGVVDCSICDIFTTNEFNDEWDGLNKYLRTNETCAFICNNDHCVHFSQLNDGTSDCYGSEGPIDETLGKLETADTCFNKLGHRFWAPKCVYVKDRFDVILGCRDLSHLKNCTHFACPEGYAKCPNAYCIPQRYVLDGRLDCPSGEDELIDSISPCTGNFVCWNSKMCLHPDLVCDGHRDCPHGDDEAGCSNYCVEGFLCVAGTITVLDPSKPLPVDRYRASETARFLDLSGYDLSLEINLLYLFESNVRIVKLSNCRIRNLLSLLGQSSLRIIDLDVSYNLIQELDGRIFHPTALQNVRRLDVSHNRDLVTVRGLSSQFLESLDFSHTALTHIDKSKFAELRYLKHLDLSFTSVASFHGSSLPSKIIMETFDLRGLLLDNFHEDFLNGLTVSQGLYTDSFQLCCPQIRGANIPNHACYAPDDAISSCFDLLGIGVQRVLLWVVAVLAVLGNVTVIVYRVIWDRSALRTGYGLFVTNLGISDFIMGVYLLIIAGADYYYRGVYVLFDKSWRESVVCRIAGFLSTLSSEVSIFFIFLICLDRFLIMKFPFGQIKFSQRGKHFALFLSWTTGSLLALIPVVLKFEIYSSNAVCLGLPLTRKRLHGWGFSFGVFIVLNFSMCLVIAVGQRAIFQAMSANRINVTASSSSPRRAEDIMVAKQLSLVALANILCWFPVGIMGCLSFSEREISNDVFAWTTVFVLPINSAANPLLYTVPTLIAKWEKFKHGDKRLR